MKKIILFLLVSSFCYAQNYADLIKINYGETFKNEFENHPSDTRVKTFEAELVLPIPINDSHAILTGIDHATDHLQLYPEGEFTNLYYTTLKLGMASRWNETWGSTIVLLPKMVSDYKNLSGKDFNMGLYATFSMKKRENFSYRFGVYTSSEAFGLYITPILGWYYLSPNERFEMNMSLPINGIMTYDLGPIDVGIDYSGITRTYRVHQDREAVGYVDLSTLRFAALAQKKLFDDSVLLRAKLGYSTNEFEMYALDEKVDIGLPLYYVGDKRTQLNPDIQGSLFFKVEAVYRFHLSKSEKE